VYLLSSIAYKYVSKPARWFGRLSGLFVNYFNRSALKPACSKCSSPVKAIGKEESMNKILFILSL